MLSAPYELVIGRHGLVSNRSLLWKVGVQPLHNYQEKFVDAFPQYPHGAGSKRQPLKVIPRSPVFSQVDSRVPHTGLSTRKIKQSTDKTPDLSPLSTPPTITTTIYINRRGATQ